MDREKFALISRKLKEAIAEKEAENRRRDMEMSSRTLKTRIGDVIRRKACVHLSMN